MIEKYLSEKLRQKKVNPKRIQKQTREKKYTKPLPTSKPCDN